MKDSIFTFDWSRRNDWNIHEQECLEMDKSGMHAVKVKYFACQACMHEDHMDYAFVAGMEKSETRSYTCI